MTRIYKNLGAALLGRMYLPVPCHAMPCHGMAYNHASVPPRVAMPIFMLTYCFIIFVDTHCRFIPRIR